MPSFDECDGPPAPRDHRALLGETRMSSRSWFYADKGQQQGPFPEAQFREFIARGTVRADTLVWTEGMGAWQRAGEIPGLMSAAAGPPSLPGAQPATGGGSLSIEFGIVGFLGQALLFLVGAILIIPLPWVLIANLRWLTASTHVPGRPDLTFIGKATTILVWYLGAIALAIALAFVDDPISDGQLANVASFLIQLGLYWLGIRWFFANLVSAGQPLGLHFTGSFWGYLGWNILAVASVITIIGWAWVYTAQARWICRHIEGTRREVIFTASGLQYLWRAIVFVIGFILIIPIPWVVRWMMRWHASQIVLVERGGRAPS